MDFRKSSNFAESNSFVMPYYKRHIDQKLLEWKDAPRRKPLLIRGARQVGKSTAVRELGKTFKYYVEINLERQQSLRTLFTEDIDVKKVLHRNGVIPASCRASRRSLK